MLGKDHPDTLLSMAKYAWAQWSLLKLPEAEETCRNALIGMRKPEVQRILDVDTLVTASDLGYILTQRCKYSEAVSILSGLPEAIGAKIGEKSYDAMAATWRPTPGDGRHPQGSHWTMIDACWIFNPMPPRCTLDNQSQATLDVFRRGYLPAPAAADIVWSVRA
jgi:hypothetical protein